jgi:hypothetical protein
VYFTNNWRVVFHCLYLLSEDSGLLLRYAVSIGTLHAVGSSIHMGVTFKKVATQDETNYGAEFSTSDLIQSNLK